MITLHWPDIAVILVSFAAVFAAGLLAGRGRRTDSEEYLLAGRRLTLPGFVATLVTTWYGGILGVGEFTYRFGIVNWVTQGLFFYIFAGLFALFLAKRIQGTDIFTIPDLLEKRYGRRTALAGAAFTFLMVSPAPYVLILGILLKAIFGFPLPICLLIGIAVSAAYLYTGGFGAVVRTDMLQFVLMFSGFLILVPAAVHVYGGFTFLAANLPAANLTPTGELGIDYVLVWGFIALWTLVDPGFYQRCLAAKSGSTAQRGIFVSILFWILFDLLTCTAGLYARAALPGIDPLMAFPLLGDALLPVLLKGIFFTGMLATVMSTVDSFMFLSALTIGNDFLGRLLRRNGGRDDIRRYTQAGLVVTGTGAALVAWYFQSVIDIWYTIGSIGIPALLFPVVSSYSRRFVMRPNAAFLLMLVSGGMSFGWMLWGYLHLSGGYPVYPLAVEPMYPGILTAAFIYAVDRIGA